MKIEMTAIVKFEKEVESINKETIQSMTEEMHDKCIGELLDYQLPVRVKEN